MAHTISDPFAYDPNNPTANLPATNWSPATHYHGPGAGTPTVYWGLEEITWGAGSDLRFDFYGRTGCCPDRDNNFEVALLTGGPDGAVVAEVLGNNAPDGGSPANYLRINLGAVLTPGDRFDTIRIVGNNGNFTIAEVRLAGLLRTETLVKITDINFNSATSELSISWESDLGFLYNIRGDSEPADAGDPATWGVILENIEAAPPINTSVIAIDPGANPFWLFVVERFPKPPVTILAENFDDGDPGWTTGFAPTDLSMNTVWELGNPSGGPLTGPPNAFSGANCYGTNIGTSYGIESNTWLRSPSFTLPAVPFANLSFRQWLDIDPFETGSPLDHGQLRVLAAADLSELGVIDMNISGLDPVEWTEFSGEFPAAALGQEVILEFRFLSDNDGSFDQSGWYIDDVAVSAPAP